MPTTGRVLLVADGSNWIDGLRDLLEKEGYTVASLRDDIAAQEPLPRFRPDVLVTDVEMLRMAVPPLLASVLAWDREVPVIVMARERGWRDCDDALVAGAFRVIRKPFSCGEIVSVVAEASAHRAVRLWLAGAPKELPSEALTPVSIPFRRVGLSTRSSCLQLLVATALIASSIIALLSRRRHSKS